MTEARLGPSLREEPAFPELKNHLISVTAMAYYEDRDDDEIALDRDLARILVDRARPARRHVLPPKGAARRVRAHEPAAAFALAVLAAAGVTALTAIS